MNGEMQWVSLPVGFLNDMKIKRIRKLPDGDKIIIVWIGIICLAAKTNDKGFVYLDKDTPYDEELLTAEFDVSIELLRLAMSVFKKYGMLSVDSAGMVFVNNYLKYNEKADKLSDYREKARLRVAAFRDRQKALAPKEEDYSNSNSNNTGKVLHNVTVTLQENKNNSIDSEVIVSSQQPVGTRTNFSSIPQTNINELRAIHISKPTIDFLASKMPLIRPFLSVSTFASGKDLNSLLTAFARLYEANGNEMPTSFEEILSSAKRWRPKTETLQKTGLGRWIENRGWQSKDDNFRQETHAEAMARVNAITSKY